MSDPQCPSSKGHEGSGSKPQQPRCAAKCCWAVNRHVRATPSVHFEGGQGLRGSRSTGAECTHTLLSRTARDAGENVRTLVRSRA